LGAEEVEEAFNGGGFARAVAAKKTVATPGAHGEAEAVNRLKLSVAPGEIPDFDCRLALFHSFLLGVVLDEDSSLEAADLRSK
jgi:hypothetical protein